MSVIQLIKWWRVLDPIVRPLVGAIIKAIATDKDPKAAAERALREVTHEKMVDEIANRMGVIK